jgi:hypothetical protein
MPSVSGDRPPFQVGLYGSPFTGRRLERDRSRTRRRPRPRFRDGVAVPPTVTSYPAISLAPG